jgi:phosphoribosylanthranilate isomerase
VSVWVKVCGLTTPEAVRAALDAGADALGFVFHAPSPRNLSPERARELASAVPRAVPRVAVTLHPAQALVDAIVATFRPDLLQTDAEDFAALALPQALGRLPVLRAGVLRPDAWPARILYEGPRSGAGTVADWAEARSLATRGELVLAGGLTPANVGAAIAAVRPFGVDVSSGVERTPGTKDPVLIGDFVAAARAAAGSTAAPRASADAAR